MLDFQNAVRLITKDGRHDYVNQKNEIIHKPSVTTLVAMVYPMDPTIAPEVLKMAGIRGTCVHNRMEVFAEIGLVMPCDHHSRTHEDLFIKAKTIFLQVKQHFGFQEYYTEVALECDEYVGCLDLLVRTKDDQWIIFDYKTSSTQFIKDYQKFYAKESMQLRLYERMLPVKISNWIIINPNKSGNQCYSLNNYMPQADQDIEKVLTYIQKER